MKELIELPYFSTDEVNQYLKPELLSSIDIEELCDFIKNKSSSCYRGEWNGKEVSRRLFILPDGYMVRCQRVHPTVEQECIRNKVLPALYPDAGNYKPNGCPLLEALGLIRVMAENALVLNITEPTKAQYRSIEFWLDKYANNIKEYEVVFQNPLLQEHIEPKDFENFDTTSYVMGLIRKHYHPYGG